MPELPEVETIRRDLLPLVLGRTISSVHIAKGVSKLIQEPQRVSEFKRGLCHYRIDSIDRRGKYLLFHLSSKRIWIVHLRMTGSLFHRRRHHRGERFVRAWFRLDDETWLCFADLRKLGMMWLVEDTNSVVGRLGPEPLGEDFTPEWLVDALSRRSTRLKSILLDQRVTAGIGNIYADEALFIAKLNPQRAACNLRSAETRRLHTAIRTVLAEAVDDRGSTFRDYVDVGGKLGGHQTHLRVFRRTDQPCLQCHTPIRRIKVGGRSSHYCPLCQR